MGRGIVAAGRTKARARRLPRAQREERMLDAGERLFAERGFRAVSMDEIAVASGITKALLYQYFGSKEELYVACVERGRARLFDHLERAAAGAPDPAARLRVVATGYFDYLADQRDNKWILYGDASMDAIDEMRRRNAEVIARLIRGALDGMRVPDDRIAFLGHMIVGAGEQIGRWWLEHTELPKDRVTEHFVAATGAAIAGVLGA
jgi:AcrR family transcriptional regulator